MADNDSDTTVTIASVDGIVGENQIFLLRKIHGCLC